MIVRISLCTILIATATAAASGDDANALVGPVLGVSFKPGKGFDVVFGIEGGGGVGPERINVGLETRAAKLFGYLEVDPWLFVGGSLGVGIDEDSDVHPILGLWEGLPVSSYPCGNGEWHFLATVSVGVRYTGAFELYVAPKLGGSRNGCID